jgi:hypothetical protein
VTKKALDYSLRILHHPSVGSFSPLRSVIAEIASKQGSEQTTMADTKKDTPAIWNAASIFVSKKTYAHVTSEFHPFHRHDLNVALHLITTGVGVWGAFQLAATVYDLTYAVYAFAALIALTTPLRTALLHTAFCYACLQVPAEAMTVAGYELTPLYVCLAAIVSGYGLQDLAHYICQEKTYMDSYIGAKPWMLIVHSIWLMPLVVDAVLMRSCFLPTLFVSRNRCVVTRVASSKAVEGLRSWVNENVPSTPETTHVWPHKQEGTDTAATALEEDSGILAGFRRVFAAHHFDVKPIVGMNEIYVTAVGAKRGINSDAVFYTPHEDGPFWFLPQASCYRVLVGLTPNCMVRTRFNMQHESQDQVLDMYSVVGFDYNRELHWIDHIPDQVNKERRSVLKLHYVVYPKGWHAYGNFVAWCNQSYNTWARNNFLRTLRPASTFDFLNAWWIWMTTFCNYKVEESVGYANIVYLAATYAMGPTPFMILTSFRHYCVYMSTFAYREPMVAHGSLMRDAKFYKTIALMHLGRRLLPLVELPGDLPGVVWAAAGFMITILATVRLGFVRTYFGSELGFVKPQWIEGFPYGTIPHPMIVGQLIGYTGILYWFWERLTTETVALIGTHMSFYTAHMVQEMLTSSY